MEEVAGVEQSEKLTGTQVYAIIQKEILANTIPSRPVRQAPRMLVGVISMLENLVVSELTSVCYRIYAWWILVQSWGTLRFDDHRGVKPQDVSFVEGSLLARLTRSKTLGPDRSVGSRQIFINASCFIERKEWLHEGWRVLCTAATLRSGLFTPVTDHQLQRMPAFRVEVRYSTRNAEPCVRTLYEKKGTLCFQGSPPSFWTPHSARAFLPSCTKALSRAQRRTRLFGRNGAHAAAKRIHV